MKQELRNLEPLRCECGAEMTLVCSRGCDGEHAEHEAARRRQYAKKPCKKCRRSFQPTGPRSELCSDCKEHPDEG